MIHTLLIKLPGPDTGIERVTLKQWHIAPGDTVRTGDDIAMIQTPAGKKYDIRVYEEGVVNTLLVQAGQELSVGLPIAELVPEESRRNRGGPVFLRLVERYVWEPVEAENDNGP